MAASWRICKANQREGKLQFVRHEAQRSYVAHVVGTFNAGDRGLADFALLAQLVLCQPTSAPAEPDDFPDLGCLCRGEDRLGGILCGDTRHVQPARSSGAPQLWGANPRVCGAATRLASDMQILHIRSHVLT